MEQAGTWCAPTCTISLSLCTSITSFNRFGLQTPFDDCNEREAPMQSPRDPEDSYQLIVTRRNASELLLLQGGSGCTLPRGAVRPRQRVAEALVAGMNV